MKKTMLVALPRCGSLALSIMMNTKKCLAHHEGRDYKNFHKDLIFRETAAYGMYLDAVNNNQNYFCCDTGISTVCIANALKTPEGKKGFLQADWQILLVTRPVVDVVTSLINVLYPKFANDLQLLSCSAIITETQQEIYSMVSTIKEHIGNKILHINKEGRHFSKAQLTAIADFVGSGHEHLDLMREYNISMSERQLKEGATAIDEAYRKRSSKVVKSN